VRPLRQLFSVRFNWPRYLTWARVAIGFVGVVTVLRSPGYPFLFAAALVAFTTYALMVALRRPSPKGALALLELFADAVLFLVLANNGVGYSVWLPSVFYLYLLSTVLVFYHPRETAVIVAACSIFCGLSRTEPLTHLERTVVVGGLLALAFSISKARAERRVEELSASNAAAAAEAKSAREDERQRIASDFHDGPLQSFISLQMRLEIVRKLLERDLKAGMQELHTVQDIAKSQVRELRAFLHSMRPVELDGGNLSMSARRVIDNFQKESGIPVTLVGGDASLALSQDMMAEVLQMLREALHNVQKHAAASRVAVSIQKGDKLLELSVDDNGRGFHFSGTYSLEELELLQLGPASLKRRARSLNADLVLESRPGQGAGLKMRIPA
jgi:two-component system sensor histidine kinase DegS